jgi:hypothetical protein
VLDVILMDHRLPALVQLVLDGNEIGGMEGVPGWLLERRDVADEGNTAAYPDWPTDARFRARVDERGYTLAHPDMFLTRAAFVVHLSTSFDAYVAGDGARAADPSVTSLRHYVQLGR